MAHINRPLTNSEAAARNKVFRDHEYTTYGGTRCRCGEVHTFKTDRPMHLMREGFKAGLAYAEAQMVRVPEEWDKPVTRSNQQPDTIYVDPDTNAAFVSPDGEGRFYYENAVEAIGEHGRLPVVHAEWRSTV